MYLFSLPNYCHGSSALLNGGSVWSSTIIFVRLIKIYHSTAEIKNLPTAFHLLTCYAPVPQILLTIH